MDSTQEFNCIFCKETFKSKEELQIHFRKHGDPKFNQRNKARTNDTPGEKSSEGVEMIGCDVCAELFPTISKAITHKHKFHPDHDAKYFCPWCGKLFTMKHLYNKHISTNHENENTDSEDFPCDCCDVTFYEPSAMLYHNKFFHRQDTDLPAIGHSKKLKMINQCSLMIYYCPFCGQQYNNKVNLHKHMTDDHSDENQSPDDVLRCPLCDAIFYHLDAYEHHLSFHSIEDMYNESNEMAESVTEFSLESVPPIMERVENLEPDPKETSDSGAMGLDDLLLAMGNSNDEDNMKKSKKHKKHKKSKKAAITLDEFLNMNKDVFGEGIDFEGIEEVPSQVVAKRFKVKKKAALSNSGSKMSPKEIEKLRKQGIIIKKKGGTTVKKPIVTKVKQTFNKSDTNISPKHQAAAVKAPNEVLTKLINQSNNQIKIVRKPAQNKTEANSMEDEKPSSPENIEVECDLIQRYTSSETEGDDKSEKINKFNEDEVSDNDSNKTKCLEDFNTTKLKNDCIESNQNSQNNVLDNDTEDNNENIDRIEKIKNSNNPLMALRKVSQHITVKPVISSVKNNATLKNEISANVNNGDLAELKQKGHFETKDTSVNEAKDKSLNALKHLGHLITIKPIIQSKTAKLDSPSRDSQIENTDNMQMNSDDDDGEKDANITLHNEHSTTTNRNNITPELEQASQKSLNPFKSVSNNVTIKPMTKKIQTSQSDMSQSSDEDEKILNSTQKEPANYQSSVRPMALKQQNEVKRPALSQKVNQCGISKLSKDSQSVEGSTKCQSSIDILKNLKNVTAKPISNPQNIQINKCITPANKKVTQTQTKNKEENEIEVFNIDDSDSDNADYPLPSQTLLKTKVTDIQTSNLNSKSAQAFKNLNKHLTIKSTNQKIPQVNIKAEHDLNDELTDLPQRNSDSETEYHEDNYKALSNKHNKILQNTLKNLSKHITIKSRNSSPGSVVSNYGNKNEDSNDKFDTNNFDSDNDSNPGKVQITEVSDEHLRKDKDDEFDEDFNDEAIVQSPHDSDSDPDGDYSQSGDLGDIESKILANTVRRNDTKNNESFNKISKAISIKSLSEKKAQSHCTETASMTKGLDSLPSNLSKELSIKPFKPGNEHNVNVGQQPNKIIPPTINKNNKSAGQQIARCTNQTSNQKMCVSKNQTNTVNKEVTVKTFQTKTVIQEITTTVTKTIKTVNQTMKQEVQTASQSCTQNALRKVQGMRPQTPQPVKNYQGVVVRHAAPVGSKIRGQMPPNVRSPRPNANVSNQLVPVRSGATMNVRTPRMPTVRTSTPSTSTNSPKPVKMSPNIVNTTMNKRPAAPESAGHFSCFKKPKESLIPVSDISSFNSREDESMISFASSTQMNKSNVMNMTRTVKGNKVVSSTQMKSEISSCSQQLDKLNNMTGLRIVRTSQVKNASHVEEKQEINPAKKIALEAIEKLQKQGLLIKKPRLDTDRDEDRYSDDDDEGDSHFPQDEDFDDECY